MRTFEKYFILFTFALGMILTESNGEDYEAFYEKLLELHNEFRAMHNAGELVLENKMNEEAMKCAINHELIRRKERDYGVNYLAFNTESLPDANEVFKSWYEEGKYYNYATGPSKYGPNTNAFTQIVWKSTEKLGLALLRGPMITKVVATYDPPGNIEGEYLLNVEKSEGPQYKKMRLY